MFDERSFRRKLRFLENWSCSSKEALSESCVFEVLSKVRFLEGWSCNSKEASSDSYVFDALSAVIRRKPQTKAVFLKFGEAVW